MSSSIVSRAYRHLFALGPMRTAQTLISIAEDKLFDWRHGVDTLDRIPQSQLQVISPEHQAEASPYFMTRVRAVRHLLRRAGVPRDAGFVDIGCGKGRVVMVAALHGFKTVTGIEFAPELASAASVNLSRLRSRIPPGTTASIVCADAAKHDYGPEDRIFYMNDPFGPVVMESVCTKLRESLERFPRPIWVIYGAPKHLDVVTRVLPVRSQGRIRYGGFEHAVFVSEPN